MSPVLNGTIAPLVYSAAAVCVLLGIGFAHHLSSGARGRTLLGVGFVLAIVGRVMEVGVSHSTLGVACVLGGAVLGVVLASQAKSDAAPGVFAWIAAAGGASAGASALGYALSGEVDAINGLAAYAGAGLGALAALQGVGVTLGASGNRNATANAATTALLAGAAMGALGIAIENVIVLVVGGAAACAGVGVGRVIRRAQVSSTEYANVRACGAEEAAMVIAAAQNVLIIPGFGMAAAQAQHAVKQLADTLDKHGTKVRYAVHPSAGCVPGHLNGVLDEANVPHSAIAELDEANALAAKADVVLCLGANDVINPSHTDKQSAVYGMPTIDVSKARAVFVVKRSLKAGAAGAKNPIFEAPQTTLVFGDAKKVTQQIVTALSGGH